MKLLVLGASGLVGSAVAAAAGSRHRVFGVVGRHAQAVPGAAEVMAVDLALGASVSALIQRVQPDAVINCAAVSIPTECDADPVRSEAMNVALPASLAQQAANHGFVLVHVSSEQVFAGRQTAPYSPRDPTAPINLYGRQKVASEQAVMAAAAAATAVVRAPLLMGDSPGGRRGVHERLFADWSAGRAARLYRDEYRQPCTAASLARVLVALTESPRVRGIFHWAGAELLSRYELGRRIREHFGLSETRAPIVPVLRADTPEVARERQPCLAIDVSPLPSQLGIEPPTIAEQLSSLHVPASSAAWFAAQ